MREERRSPNSVVDDMFDVVSTTLGRAAGMEDEVVIVVGKAEEDREGD